MNRRLKGALSIEAAIVLPLVIFAFVSVLFFAKIYYIQDQVHSAMTKAAHDISVDVYALDQLGLVDLQQGVYLEGAEGLGDIKKAARTVSDNAGTLLVTGSGIVDYGHEFNDWLGDTQSEIQSEGWGSDFYTVGKKAMSLLSKAPGLAEEVGDSLGAMMDAIHFLYEEGVSGLGGVVLMEAVDFSNGLLADKMSEAVFYKYLPEENLEAWGISSGTETIDFSMSSLMLYDDTVQLTATYEIDIPFGQAWFGQSIPVLQTVRARAWTGSYDAEDQKHRHRREADEDVERIYYISNLDKTKSYHYYTCLRKPTMVSSYGIEVADKGRAVCQYCEDHIPVTGSNMKVYYTSLRAKVHYDDECPRIWSPDIQAVTIEEAEAAGHGDPCSKYNCVDDPRKRHE